MPIPGTARPVGALAVELTDGPAREPAGELLELIARRTGEALERAELYEAEAAQRARAEHAADRAVRLEELTGAFSASADVDELVATILDPGLVLIGAAAAPSTASTAPTCGSWGSAPVSVARCPTSSGSMTTTSSPRWPGPR